VPDSDLVPEQVIVEEDRMTKSRLAMVVSFVALTAAVGALGAGRNTGGPGVRSIYDFTMKDIDGKQINLADFKGKVALVVNVASRCGFTPQYEGLQKLYLKYREQGFVILGFPANNFGFQEPGTNAEIKSFCSAKYNVTFPIFSKISVKGDDIDPLYRFLTEKDSNPQFGGDIMWNFNKFLIDRKGNIIARFEPKVKPESDQMVQAIEKALQP
jgi:glutathione peroxidase